MQALYSSTVLGLVSHHLSMGAAVRGPIRQFQVVTTVIFQVGASRAMSNPNTPRPAWVGSINHHQNKPVHLYRGPSRFWTSGCFWESTFSTGSCHSFKIYLFCSQSHPFNYLCNGRTIFELNNQQLMNSILILMGLLGWSHAKSRVYLKSTWALEMITFLHKFKIMWIAVLKSADEWLVFTCRPLHAVFTWVLFHMLQDFHSASANFCCKGPGSEYIWFMDIQSLSQPLGFVTAVGERSWTACEQRSTAVTQQRFIDKNKPWNGFGPWAIVCLSMT